MNGAPAGVALLVRVAAGYNINIMNISIKGTGIELTTAISEYVEKRLDKVRKLLGDDPALKCDIELARTTGHHQKGEIFRAEVHIVGSGKNIYTASEKEDLYSAIDDMRDETLRELKADRKKRISLVRRGGARVKAMMKGIWPWGKTSA